MATINNRIEDLRMQQVVYCILLLLCWLVVVYEAPVLSLVFLCPAVGMVTTYYGISICLQKKKVKEYFSLFGYRFGNWEPIVEYEYIMVRAITEKIVTNRWYQFFPTSTENQVYKVFLMAKDREINRYLNRLLFTSHSKDRAMEKANEIGKVLNLQSKWTEF